MSFNSNTKSLGRDRHTNDSSNENYRLDAITATAKLLTSFKLKILY